VRARAQNRADTYAPTELAAKEFRQAIRAYLVCPGCGVSEQAGVVLRCLGCRLRWHVRRADLAASVRTKAAAAVDPRERALLDRLAILFEPWHHPRHTYGATPPADDAEPRAQGSSPCSGFRGVGVTRDLEKPPA
jgi:hypothetical protein